MKSTCVHITSVTTISATETENWATTSTRRSRIPPGLFLKVPRSDLIGSRRDMKIAGYMPDSTAMRPSITITVATVFTFVNTSSVRSMLYRPLNHGSRRRVRPTPCQEAIVLANLFFSKKLPTLTAGEAKRRWCGLR